MIAERIQQETNEFSTSGGKYYPFSAIVEHVIDCFHTIVSDETNPYHPPLGWLTRRQPKPPNDELFLDLIDECSKKIRTSGSTPETGTEVVHLSSSVRTRLERCPQQLRREIVSKTQNGCSPLFMACRNGLTRAIKYLIDVCDADIEQKGLFEAFEDHHVHNVSPIWVAAVSGQLDVVKLLIDRGANVNSLSDTGSTPIRSVCFMCIDDDGTNEYDNFNEDTDPFGEVNDDKDNKQDVYMKIVHLLVENGADISRPNNSGGTCLINSLHNYRLTGYMIRHGADVDALDGQSRTALHYAILQDRIEVAKLLLDSGSDPYLTTDFCDDALQLCCIGGHVNIFKHLIENYTYSPERLSDAYKLLGSSILELHYDLSQVRNYWTKSLEILASYENATKYTGQQGSASSLMATASTTSISPTTSSKKCTAISQTRQPHVISSKDDKNKKRRSDICDVRRSFAYGGAAEFASMSELHRLTMDDFRIQSLLISERVMGQTHRETIQRLLYRGTFYINSLRPNRCLDLWIYALRLRLEVDSIHHFESIFAAQAITKFFFDLFSQRQQHQVKFNDVYDVLSMLVSRLHECQQPTDIFDLLLSMIINLLLVLRCTQKQWRSEDQGELVSEMIRELIKLDPRTSKGSSMLHLCVATNILEGEIHRSLVIASGAALDSRKAHSPVIELIDYLMEAGLDVDSTNNDGLSALQTICLASSINAMIKKQIVELLVKNGAHVDRRALTVEQDERIKQTLRESGVRLIDFVTLKCLAARKVSEVTRPKLDKGNKVRLSRNLRELIAIH